MLPRRLVALAVATATSFAVLAAGLPTTAASATHGVLRGDLGRAPTLDGVALATKVLATQAARLGVDPTRFGFDDVVQSPLGQHIRGREVRGGVPVLGSSAAVHVANDGRVLRVEARPVNLPGTAVATPVTRQAAIGVALAHLGSTTPYDVVASRWLVASDGRLVDVWRIAVVDLVVPVVGTVEVQAADSRVLRVVDERRFIDGAALVFDPNPIVKLQDPTLRQEVDVAGVDVGLDEYSDARVSLDLIDVDIAGLPAGILRGPWVNAIGGTAIPPPVNGHWLVDLDRNMPQFETLMAYTHLDRIQRYFQERLGFVGATGVNAESQEIITFPVPGFDNSFYQPGNDLMLLGGGGVDDGEDAEVILHEYGHAVQDAQVPGWGSTHEGGAMGEGFGDFLAGAFYASHSSLGYSDTCLMEWDSTSYSSEDPTCIRRMDREKVYPDDMDGSVHSDGEIWSKYLWNVRERIVPASQAAAMGAAELATQRTDRVLKAILNAHFLLTPTATFADTVSALQQVAEETGDRHLLAVVESQAKAIGFDYDPLRF